MYVCVCKAITEREVKEAIASGCKRFSDLQACLGVATQCGGCRSTTEDLLEQHDTHPPMFMSTHWPAAASAC